MSVSNSTDCQLIMMMMMMMMMITMPMHYRWI